MHPLGLCLLHRGFTASWVMQLPCGYALCAASRLSLQVATACGIVCESVALPGSGTVSFCLCGCVRHVVCSACAQRVASPNEAPCDFHPKTPTNNSPFFTHAQQVVTPAAVTSPHWHFAIFSHTKHRFSARSRITGGGSRGRDGPLPEPAAGRSLTTTSASAVLRRFNSRGRASSSTVDLEAGSRRLLEGAEISPEHSLTDKGAKVRVVYVSCSRVLNFGSLGVP